MSDDVSFKNSRGLTLAGSFFHGSSNAIVIMAHGATSNRLWGGKFEKIATALCNAGYSVLSFDFSGHGESEDDIITLGKAADDLKSAIAFVKEHEFERIALFGHSLGAFACLSSFCPEVETMVLIGGLTGPVEWKWEEMCTPEQLEELKKKGYASQLVNDGLRETVRVDAKILADILEIDQETLLKNITCPVLVVHGDTGQQELDLLAFSKKALSFLPKESQLKIIEGAPHSFTENAEEIAELTTEWLKSHFSL
jgi:pimeloyl-ACP methyl ester carboxylesterase